MPELDGLRALAVIAVVLLHYTSDNFPVTSLGWVGVDLFFVISGYLITTILLRSRSRGAYYKNFYARRALRIFPPYYLLLVCILIINFWLTGRPPLRVWACFFTYTYALTLTFTPHWSVALPAIVSTGLYVTWSLSIEELFYVFWAPTVRLLSARHFKTLLITLLCIEPPLRLFVAAVGGNVYDFFPIRLDGLAFGALVAVWLDACPRATAAKALRRTALPAAGAAVIAVALAARGATNTVFLAFGYTPLVAAFGYGVAYCVANSGQSQLALRLLRGPAVRSIGRTSYVIYLVHYPVRMIVQTLVYAAATGRNLVPLFVSPNLPRLSGFAERAMVATIAAAVSLAVAQLSWHYFESPILRFKDRFVPALAEPGPLVAAVGGARRRGPA